MRPATTRKLRSKLLRFLRSIATFTLVSLPVVVADQGVRSFLEQHGWLSYVVVAVGVIDAALHRTPPQ